jgi:hypothetical protein
MRHRSCTLPSPYNGGRTCEEQGLGEAEERQACVNGGWGGWEEWSECKYVASSASASASMALVEISTNGKDDDDDDNNANAHHYQQRYRVRARSCSSPSPSNGGQACEGESRQKHVCIDGGWGAYGDWSICDVSNYRMRVRECNLPLPQNGGGECVGERVDKEKCIDGGFSEWGAWGECHLESRNRTRTCTHPAPANGGKACQGPLMMTEDCTHGAYSEWSPWGTCIKKSDTDADADADADSHSSGISSKDTSKRNNVGTMNRTRTCSNPAPQNGGMNCVGLGASIEWSQCYDGGWSEYGPWSDCDPTTHHRHRVRACNNPLPKGGKGCVGDAKETQQCIHAGWSEWSVWSNCVDSSSYRTRTCDNPVASNGGKDCVLAHTDAHHDNHNGNGNGNGNGNSNSSSSSTVDGVKQDMEYRVCVNGGFGSWSEWSDCDVTTKTRSKTRRCNNPR